MFRFEDKPKVKWAGRCVNNGKGPCVTKSGWLIKDKHEYKVLDNGVDLVCKACYDRRGKEREEYYRKPPEAMCEIAKRHERIGYYWGIRRTRQRTDKYPGSDRWTCDKCGRRGDFFFFENFECPKEPEEKIELAEGQQQLE